MKNFFCIFAIALLSVRCSEPIGPKLGEEFDLKIDERVVVQNQNLFIKFKAVDGDSRCPGRRHVYLGGQCEGRPPDIRRGYL